MYSSSRGSLHILFVWRLQAKLKDYTYANKYKIGMIEDDSHLGRNQGSELYGRPLKVPKRRLKETKFYIKGDY